MTEDDFDYDSGCEAEFTTNIRPLTAEEYCAILKSHDVELRVSDGTSDGTWRFWMYDDQLVYRRLVWTQNKPTEPSFMQNILDEEDVTRQLLAASET